MILFYLKNILKDNIDKKEIILRADNSSFMFSHLKRSLANLNKECC